MTFGIILIKLPVLTKSMGFDCLSEVDLRISYYVEASYLSDSLVNDQILREIRLLTSRSAQSYIVVDI